MNKIDAAENLRQSIIQLIDAKTVLGMFPEEQQEAEEEAERKFNEAFELYNRSIDEGINKCQK